MKIIFISDIHGKADNLPKIEQIIYKEKINLVVILGDIYGYDELENDKIDNFISKHQPIIMKGNCDTYNPIFESEDPKHLKVDNLDLYLTHGNHYNYYLSNIDGILIYGHEHIPYIRKKGENYYICVGSISKPRNDLGYTYLLYENKKFTLYDIEDNMIDKIEIR